MLEVLAKQHALLLTSTVQKLELKDGDVVLFKLGDPATSWIPDHEAAVRFNELVQWAFETSGISNKVSAVIWDYGANAEVIRAAQPPAVAAPDT